MRAERFELIILMRSCKKKVQSYRITILLFLVMLHESVSTLLKQLSHAWENNSEGEQNH